MMLSMLALSFMLSSMLEPAFLSGTAGLYTESASFFKPGALHLSFMESIGTLKDEESSDSWWHNQLSANIQYAPFSRLLMSMCGTSYTMREETERGVCSSMKLPLIKIGRFNSSIAPYAQFASSRKPAFGGKIYLDWIPFSAEQLPPLLFSNEFAVLRCDNANEYRIASVLSFHKGQFLPFIEFYTEFQDKLNWESSYNARAATGLSFSRNPLNLRVAVEIPLNEYEKRDFDFRFGGALGFSFDTKRRAEINISLFVLDAESNEKLNAQVTIKGKEFSETRTCIDGSCTISGLIAGIYTIEIVHPGYKKMRYPLFVKNVSIDREFKLTKSNEVKGGE